MHRAQRLALAFVLVAASCGGRVVFDSSAGAGGTGGNSANPTGPTTGPGGWTCQDGGIVIPESLRTCATDTECALGDIHECCGELVVGIASAQADAFDAYEQACNDQPVCQCDGPTRAEDGKTGNIVAHCVASRCVSSVP